MYFLHLLEVPIENQKICFNLVWLNNNESSFIKKMPEVLSIRQRLTKNTSRPTLHLDRHGYVWKDTVNVMDNMI